MSDRDGNRWPRGWGRPSADAGTGGRSSAWPVVLQAALVILVAGLVAAFLINNFSPTAGGARATPSARARTMRPIDRIRCDSSEQFGYHVHAHLTVLDAGKSLTIPAYVGIPSDSCLYWLHTHDDSGIIHIEAPSTFRPRLGEFFDIWGQPLSSHRVMRAAATGQRHMRVFVNGHFYTGNPWRIRLYDHTDITLEVGPPFRPPTSFDFAGSGY